MKITILPDSVRLNPVTLRLFEHQPTLYKRTLPEDYQNDNPVWNQHDKVIRLKSAANETVAFQAVLFFDEPLEIEQIKLLPLNGPETIPESSIELFKEWFVDVQVPSSGYEKTSFGSGWYPDALIPLDARHQDWGLPFHLPDYWNRIPGQKACIIWADIYVPRHYPAGNYRSTLTIQAKGRAPITLPVELSVWPFSLPDKNNLRGNLYTNTFRSFSLEKELRYQHAFKKHRLAAHQCYYRPHLTIQDNDPVLDWTDFDKRLTKYFNGSAFTAKYGYTGPGEGEPIEFFLLPFNCSGKKNAVGWPLPTTGHHDDTFWKIWDKTAHAVRQHLIDEKRIDLKKTETQIFFNSLDECYDRADHERMITWATFLKKHFPECPFRIDGGYDDATMDFLSSHVDLCLYHTVAYDYPFVKKFRDKGIRDWIYGPVVYESKTNELTGASTFIDLDLLTMRGLAWTVYKYGADTWCQWEFASENKQAWFNPENFKNNDLADFRCYNGNGMLLYDGEFLNLPDPCISIRFKAGRSGAQEFEYLKLYESLGGNAMAFVDALIDKPFGPNAIGNLEPWNPDISAWDKARLALGNAIANKIINYLKH
ncbi:MAG: hypothetical protein A2293_07420 [Elusimicrobia bacterium RIFOXYB2_FULL_49_7]|nr:MAG: hypothetical protein A2293_07420 [Elusimicrobia bacterium RIFOXYB2_FULL_49_7]